MSPRTHGALQCGTEAGSEAWALFDKTTGAVGWVYVPRVGAQAVRQQANDGYK